jgi:asparagine synthase (glutamine-hydrolysing)
MCGIVGYAGISGAIDGPLAIAMRDALAHRGPDGAGIWSAADGSVVLGHRRLAILDLSATGAQPMVTADQRLAITFNGEIYNHGELRAELAASGARFVGRSDTEVLLAAYAAWGERCVARLRGMFAFAIYDATSRSLFMARDRAGEKPLYWARHRDGLVFASELKALLVDPAFHPRISAQGLGYYLALGYVPAGLCILDGVHKLMPAHYLSWHIGDTAPAITRYWDLPEPQLDTKVAAEAELVDELDCALTASIREQLVADVPVAVLLSGGVDSSVVTGIAARVSSAPVRTFTIGIPGDPELDESAYARRVARHFATDHVELPLDASSVNLIQTLARQYDEPIADSSMIPTYLLARTVSRHCKVVLGGDGGDELFGGYRSYQSLLRLAQIRALLPSPVRTLAAGLASTLPLGTRGRNAVMSLRGSMAAGIGQLPLWYTDSDAGRVSPWLRQQNTRAAPAQWRCGLVQESRGLPGAAMAADFRSYLPEDILVKVDRAAMLCSLEVRAPYLDTRVIEFAFRAVPNCARVTAGDRKILLKALAKRLLPVDLDLDRKQGFEIPLWTWLTPAAIDEWSESCREQIRAVFTNGKALERSPRPKGRPAFTRLYAMMMLTWWMRQYGVSL